MDGNHSAKNAGAGPVAVFPLEASDEFLDLLGYHLRNTLEPIRNAVHLLRRADQDSSLRAFACTIVERQAARLNRWVDDLLDASRLAQGRLALRKEPLELVAAVRGVLEDGQAVLEETGLGLEAVLPATPLWMEADRGRLVQILGGLLQHAMACTGRGGHITVTVGEPERGWAQVTVTDTGIGIPPGQLDRMFEPSRRDPDRTGACPGESGLGLALVKGLAELHGGTVSVQSKGSGWGSVFALRLPLRPRGLPAAEQPRSGLLQGGRPRRILIVEDLLDAAITLEFLLEMMGHEVEIAPDGEAGLAKALRFEPEVILCDLGLPGELDGFQVARAVRSAPRLKDAYLIALTGYDAPADRDQTRQAGFDLHLTKPVDPEALAALIGSIPDSGRA